MYQNKIHHNLMYSPELLKGTLQPILLRLLADQGPMYGYQISQEVKRQTDGKILLKEGSLYPTLHSMAARGWLETESRMIGKRVRKYYSLSPTGKASLAEKMEEVVDFLQTLGKLIHTQPPRYVATI